jgi:hypothetical protein
VKPSLCLVALSLAMVAPVVARADGATDDQKAAARILGTDGVRAAMAGDCHTAVDKLSRAEALVHAPTTALPLAKCQIQLGKLVAGTEILNRMLNETLPPNAPEPWVDAKRQVPALLEATAPKIGRLRVHVDRPAGATGDVQVTIDGGPMPSVLLDNDRPTDPGAHHVMATAAGFTTAAADVSLTEGQSRTVSLRIDPLPTSSAAAAVPAGSPTPAATSLVEASAPPPASGVSPGESTPPSSRDRTPAYVVLGIGGVALVVGATFGVIALGNKSSLNSDCPAGKNACPASKASDVQSLNSSLDTHALVSTIALALGAVGVGVGAYLFFSAPSSNAKTAGLDVHPWLGLGSAGLNGTF